MKVSIIVPVYNIDEKILRECLDSVVQQTISDYEVIIVDDGSEKKCADVCDEYGTKYDFVKVIHQLNQGVSVARNYGIDIAQGKYIQFVDADDWLEKDATEKYYQFAEEHHLDIMLSSCVVEGGMEPQAVLENRIMFESEIRALQLTILNNNPEYLGMWPMSPWAKLFRREYIKDNQIRYVKGIKRMQDNIFCMYAYEKAKKAGFLAYQGYHYRQNASSVCHKYNEKIRDVLEPVLLELKKFIDCYHSEDVSFKKAYQVKCFVILVSEYTRLYYMHEDNPNKRIAYQDYKKLCNEQLYKNVIQNVEVSDCHRSYKIYCFLLKKKMYYFFWNLLKFQRKFRE